METFVFLRMEIIVLGLFSIGLVLTVIYNIFKEMKISSVFIGVIGFLLIGGFPTWGFYVNLNKYLTEPEPVNLTETCIDEEIRIIYHDTTHFCPSSYEYSSTFSSFLSPKGEVSKMDTCIVCGRPFIDHDTYKEQNYYKAIYYMNTSNYCYKPKSEYYAIMSIDEVGTVLVGFDTSSKNACDKTGTPFKTISQCPNCHWNTI